MITKTININTPQIITIGRQLENNYRQFIFDCSSFGEVESVELVHQRSVDEAPYLVGTTSGNKVTWTVNSLDTSFPGYGQCELRISFTNGLAKSLIFQTLVIESITAEETIPSALQSWYDAMILWIDEHSITQEELDEAVAEYIAEHPITETDPVFLASAAHTITSANITAWNNKSDFSGNYNDLTNKPTIPTKVSDLVDDSGHYTKPSGGIPVSDLNSTARSRLMPTGGSTGQVLSKASGTNYDVEWTTPSGGVSSVNGKTGAVTLNASDVGALADTYTAPVSSVNTKTGAVTLTASDVGALSSSTTYVSSFNGSSGAVTYTAPVTSVNGQTGAVTGLAEAWTIENKTSADTSVTLQTGKFYVFPEMSTLTVTVTATGMYAFRFTSGTTATVLTVTGATMPDSFAVEASKVYEVNVYQGYAVVSSWTA